MLTVFTPVEENIYIYSIHIYTVCTHNPIEVVCRCRWCPTSDAVGHSNRQSTFLEISCGANSYERASPWAALPLRASPVRPCRSTPSAQRPPAHGTMADSFPFYEGRSALSGCFHAWKVLWNLDKQQEFPPLIHVEWDGPFFVNINII